MKTYDINSSATEIVSDVDGQSPCNENAVFFVFKTALIATEYRG